MTDPQAMLAVCLAGPTAAGKTAVALDLARRYPVEIISVDSAMVYRGMNIGTAKPGADILESVPHHLIDIRDPWETYSAGDFRRDAEALIRKIIAGGRLPLLVGGTMLYLRALQRGLAPLPAADPALRQQIDARGERLGWDYLHAELQRLDPAAASHIHPADRQRIQRALEVLELSGERISDLQQRFCAPTGLRFVNLALLPGNRAALHQRIALRFDRMLAEGFVEEVERLRTLPGLHAGMPAMRAVGYRQIWAYLEGDVDIDEASRRAVVATRRYARRQLTWLRAEADFQPVDCQSEAAVDQVATFLEHALGPDALSRPRG